jgi:hypothetical protein
MRTRLAVGLTLLLTLGLVGPAPALVIGPRSAAIRLPVAGVLSSANVTYHGTIPIDSPGVGGEVVVREDLGKTLFVATGLKGLTIYDVSDPALPILAGHLPFAHAQNEDVKVSDDGRTVMIAADGSLLGPVNPVTTGITLIDVTDPLVPTIVASSNDRVMRRGTGAGIAEHTAECANADCSVIYGRTGRIYQVDFAAGTVIETGRWNTYTDADGATRQTSQIHALNRDETGLVIADSTPRLVLDPTGAHVPGATPLEPAVLAFGGRAAADNNLQHNNVRVDAAAWVPRDADDPADDLEVVPAPARSRSVSIAAERPVLRPGELFLGNTETNLNPTCANAGGLSSWSMANFDRGATLQPLEVFKPLNGTWLDGSPLANALGCSGHWFTYHDGIVAASWYEHGIRFFAIDPEIGTIDEVGYFQPVATEAGAAHWIDDTFVYSVDYARGIDIVSFDREADPAGEDELVSSWLANLGRVGELASAERMLCRLAVQ